MELPNPDNFGLKAFTHRKSQNILTVSQIKFANKLLNQDNLQYKIQVSEQDLVHQFFEYKKTKSVQKLEESLHSFLSYQNEFCK